jgi:hypothetical protein
MNDTNECVIWMCIWFSWFSLVLNLDINWDIWVVNILFLDAFRCLNQDSGSQSDLSSLSIFLWCILKVLPAQIWLWFYEPLLLTFWQIKLLLASVWCYAFCNFRVFFLSFHSLLLKRDPDGILLSHIGSVIFLFIFGRVSYPLPDVL